MSYSVKEVLQMLDVGKDDCFMFRKACADGNIELVKALFEHQPAMSEKAILETFQTVCKNGYMEIARFLKQIEGEQMLCNDSCAFELACENGHLELAIWIHTNATIHFYVYLLFNKVCANGHWHVAHWLKQIQYRIGVTIFNWLDFETAFWCACKNGHIKTCDWLYTICGDNVFNDTYTSGKETTIIRRFQYLYSLNNSRVVHIINRRFRSVCKVGRVDLATTLHNLHPQVLIDNKLFRTVCSNGHLTMAQWLVKTCSTIDITSSNHYAFKTACKQRFVELAKWLKRQRPKQYFIIGTPRSKSIQYTIKEPMKFADVPKTVDALDDCFICRTKAGNISTCCGHHYCSSCITKWTKQSNTCPYCRNSLKNTVYTKLNKKRVYVKKLKNIMIPIAVPVHEPIIATHVAAIH